jgi:hypothetical protein
MLPGERSSTALPFRLGRPQQAVPVPRAGWQSGHAAACKAVYAGSIPTPASNSLRSSGARMIAQRTGDRQPEKVRETDGLTELPTLSCVASGLNCDSRIPAPRRACLERLASTTRNRTIVVLPVRAMKPIRSCNRPRARHGKSQRPGSLQRCRCATFHLGGRACFMTARSPVIAAVSLTVRARGDGQSRIGGGMSKRGNPGDRAAED